MRRLSLPWLILATVLVSALLAWWTLTRSMGGEAPPRLERENLAPFHEIEIGGNATVTLLQSGREAIDVAAAGAGNPRIRADVANGRLVIRAADRRRWWSGLGRRARAAPNITVHFRALDTIALTGSVKLDAPRIAASTLRIVASGGSALAIGDLQAQSLRVEGSGALQARLAGHVDNEHVSISGAASYLAEHLVARDATVSVSGVGNVVLHADQTLDASISGAGVIEYAGNPAVTEHVSGIGRVRRREPQPTRSVTAEVVPDPAYRSSSPTAPSSLKNSGPCVTGSMSPWIPGRKRTFDT